MLNKQYILITKQEILKKKKYNRNFRPSQHKL